MSNDMSSDEILKELYNSLNLPVSPKVHKFSAAIHKLTAYSNESSEISDMSANTEDDSLDEVGPSYRKQKVYEEERSVSSKKNRKKERKKKKKDKHEGKSKHKKKKSKRNDYRSEEDDSLECASYSKEKNKTVESSPGEKIEIHKRSRSRSRSRNYESKSGHSRSRSKSLKSRRASSHRHSSQSKSRSPKTNRGHSPRRSSKRERSRSRSLTPTKEVKDPLDIWKMTKLASLKKNSLDTKLSADNVEPCEAAAAEESIKTDNEIKEPSILSIPLPIRNEEPVTSIPPLMTASSSEEPELNVSLDITNIPVPVTVKDEINSNMSSDTSNFPKSKDKDKLKDEGKSKTIIIKSLKDSLVLQQVEEAAKHETSYHDKDASDDAEIKANLNDPTQTADNLDEKSKEHPVKKNEDIKKSQKNEEEDKAPAYRMKSDKKQSRSSGSSHKSKKKRSRSHSKSRSKSRSKRSRSRRHRHNTSSRRHSYSKPRSRRSRSQHKRSRSHSKSSHRSKRKMSKSPDCVDSLRDKATRKRLLDVARRNAVYLMKNNALPPSIEKESVKATGKSVEELTNYCKQLVAKEEFSDQEMSDPSLSPEDDEAGDKPFGVSRHPFAIKDSKPIMMNIRNAPMIPTKTNAERLADTSKLREQFPVSSGSQHRNKEGWVPVEKDEKDEKIKDAVFPEGKLEVDISALVSTRLSAMRRLQDNPQDREAITALTVSQTSMQSWALSKQVPGQFTGSTGAKILSQSELASGYQAWAKKEQFKVANPVSSHFGLKMLQKMGWNPGEGLGKNKEGQLEPLQLDVKMDKKGLTAQEEMAPKRCQVPVVKSLAGKHPVSALVELCNKRKWGPPEFEIVFDGGPDHKKNFLMKVHVGKETYQPSVAATTKKIAKANAAAACLQALGLIPKDPPPKPAATLSTVNPNPPSTLGNVNPPSATLSTVQSTQNGRSSSTNLGANTGSNLTTAYPGVSCNPMPPPPPPQNKGGHDFPHTSQMQHPRRPMPYQHYGYYGGGPYSMSQQIPPSEHAPPYYMGSSF